MKSFIVAAVLFSSVAAFASAPRTACERVVESAAVSHLLRNDAELESARANVLEKLESRAYALENTAVYLVILSDDRGGSTQYVVVTRVGARSCTVKSVTYDADIS